MTVVAVVSDIESNTLTFPPFSPTKTRPSDGEADNGGQVEPGEGRLLLEFRIRHRQRLDRGSLTKSGVWGGAGGVRQPQRIGGWLSRLVGRGGGRRERSAKRPWRYRGARRKRSRARRNKPERDEQTFPRLHFS